MENSKNLVGTLLVIAATVFMANSAAAATDDTSEIIDLVGCDAIGGTSYPQPAGSDLSFCCTEDTCYICDAGHTNCEIDTTNSPKSGGKPGRSAAGTLSKPALNGNVMIVRPDTNTTVGTPAKPTTRKLMMQRN